ncbi:hypothetical protein V1264_020307 [Littorina saxatilis]|uniref:Uncharacterized protein n=2 Tax=Littorina saxatilis TaxID=31220 RepID=A0AAN9GBD8_9CAEN
MSPDIESCTKLLQEGQIWHKVRPMIDHYHSVQSVETRVFSPTATSRQDNTTTPTPTPANGNGNDLPPAPKRRRLGKRTSSVSKKD